MLFNPNVLEKIMKTFIVVALLALSVYTESPPEEVKPLPIEDDPYRVDMRIEHLISLYKLMGPNDSKTIDLADDSYYTLSQPGPRKLMVSVMLYNPADETHYVAYEATYRWEETLGTLIAEHCADYEPPILPPKVEPFCEEGILKATEMISLQVTGIAEYEGYDMENLEKCIGGKLTPKIIEKPYMRCFFNIIGDKKYSKEALEAAIKAKEEEGYECEPNGDCVKAEDPEVFAKILEALRNEPVPIDVPHDDRPRYCDLSAKPLIGDSPDDPVEYLESYEYSCRYWVNKVYCKNLEDRLFWAVEYIDDNGHKEVFHTMAFNVLDADVTISVPWTQGIRISKMDMFLNRTDHTVQDIQFSFNKTKLPVSCKAANSPSRLSLDHGEINLKGEIGGWHFARLPGGVRVKSVIERT